MATLLLTTVGTLAGGPIGGAIGAAIGSQADRLLLSPARKGPRLGDLTVQTSTYGAAIPRIFGTMRVAGTVIWATDLREDTHRTRTKAGKTTTYSYSASLAVALSARPIRAIGRIWADGKLLRGRDGVFRSETGFRLHLGHEDQAVDPLIAAAQGLDATPAHRGIAYAVFEHLQLADFGNRIPSLSFEVVADDGPVPVGRIAETLSGGAVTGDGLALDGFAAGGDSVRGALQALEAAIPLPLTDDGAILRIDAGGESTIAADALGAAPEGDREPRLSQDRQAARTLPDEIVIGYHDVDRDYQAGLQRARRDGIGRRATRIELPAAIDAGTASALAEAGLAQRWSTRDTATIHLPWRFAAVRAGERLVLAGRRWRVRTWALEQMAVRLTLAADDAALVPGTASAGTALGADEAALGSTVLRLIELPVLTDGDPAAPRLFAAAAGTASGWRRAEISTSLDQGASWQPAGRTALPAVMGSAGTALPPGPTELFDLCGTVTIDLLHPGMALAGADRAALVGGANLAAIGGERFQFGVAEQIGPVRWRLSRLLRGRRGTEAAMAGHAAGEPFLLIEPATLLPIEAPLSAIGTMLTASAIGPGDSMAATAMLPIAGLALRPPAPVHLRATMLGDGTARIGWMRRSRIGWSWLSGGDVPLAEDAERYRLTFGRPGGPLRTVELDTPSYDYTAAARSADGIAAAIAVTVVQIGSRGPSMPAAATITL